jgi:hypothetical protein
LPSGFGERNLVPAGLARAQRARISAYRATAMTILS